MPISLFPQFFFISIPVSAIICSTNFTHAYNQCLNDQKTLLLELKKELIFDSSYSTKLVQWNTQTDDCCSWEGVECDDAGHVISLQLDWEGISGGIDEKSSSLFSLRYLKKLNLANNYFSIIQIPRGIGNLTYLTHLNLSRADFGGQVPVELSLLSRLVSLDLSSNWDIQHLNLTMLLNNLTRLRGLYLDGIDASIQASEWSQVISLSLPNLMNLSLRGCSLSSPLDSLLSQLHSLSILQLDRNNLSTIFPSFFANFSHLTILSLSHCSLKGSFSEMIFQIPTLQKLDLSYNELLSGTIPQFPRSRAFRSIVLRFTSLSGPLPDSFGNLSTLSNIDLFNCKFSGAIPPTLANLTGLVHVDLSNNFFTGLIPPFYMSKKLIYIDLSSNSLNGALSSVHFEVLSNLVFLDLHCNSLNGTISQSLLYGLPSLRRLDLSGNQFSGQLNEFSTPNFSNMVVLDLSHNRLEGPIPESFSQLENLEHLDLSYNFFSGNFQLEKIQRLPNLSSLDLSYNNLSVDASSTNSSSCTFPQLHWLGLASCNLYYFPDFIRQSSTLGQLDLSNNWIAGEIPSWIWEIGNGELSYLNLSSNLLVDLQKPFRRQKPFRIPTSLWTLDLHSNQLRDELPLPPPQASYIDYSNDSLSGAILASLCNVIDSLRILDLSVNHLSGNIPSCLLENMEILELFNLGGNNISGYIPDKFSFSCSLTVLDLINNNLRGYIPKSLGNCKSLMVMNVGQNHINDRFPCFLSSSLHVLVLRSNKFHGELRCQKSWPNLQVIDIAFNNFSGSVYPINFTSWGGMMLDSHAELTTNDLDFDFQSPIDYYRVEVTLTIKGLELQLFKIRVDFTTIDFSCNNFHGNIPDAIGDLTSLHLLNLSHNALTGPIPKSFGILMQLESLDLSINLLTGKIPTELGKLNFLSVLNLSHNKLVGVIPSGPQFLTFSADSFEGNLGLCGFPLSISCINSTHDQIDLSPLKQEKVGIEWDYVSAALGYVVGLGIVVWSLLFCQNFRERYSDKIDEVLDEIFDDRDRRRRRVLRN